MLNRNMPAVVSSALLGCWLFTACQPTSFNALEEEKERYYVAAMNRVNAMDVTGAIELFEKALEVNPRSASAHLQLGLLYEKRSEACATAIYHFEQYLKLRPNSEYDEVVRQRILGCKQELVKSVSIGPVTGELQGQIERFARENQALKEENRRLGEENRKWQGYFASLDRPLPGGGSPSPSLLRAEVASSTPDPSRISAGPTAAPSPSAGRNYEVRSGDTFYSIANRHGISVAALELANPGVDSRKLQIGQSLNLPPR
jgi:tetratricopeptide (TPR) repeat protein